MNGPPRMEMRQELVTAAACTIARGQQVAQMDALGAVVCISAKSEDAPSSLMDSQEPGLPPTAMDIRGFR